MPDLTNNLVGANYNRSFAPFTSFGTRQLAHFYIDVDTDGLSNPPMSDEELDIDSYQNPWFFPDWPNEYLANGNFQKAIRAAQQNVELYAVYRPDYSDFIIQVAMDTANTGNEDPANLNGMAQSIADAIANSLDTSVTVDHMRVRGRYFRYSDLAGAGLGTNGAQPGRTIVVKGTPSQRFKDAYGV